MDADRERQRHEALESYGILGTGTEQFYDRIATVAAAACDCPIALITFIDSDRQWFKAVVGLDLRETPRDISFCTHAVESGQMLVVEDALRDPRFADNDLVEGPPNIRFYAGETFSSRSGVPIGTVCVIDRKPRALTGLHRQVLTTLAREVELQLELRRALIQAERTSDQKSRLAAMLMHDLRNPLQVAIISAHELHVAHAHVPESRQRLDDLNWALQNLQRMTIDMLDVCAAEAGELQVRRTQVDLAALCADIERFARSAGDAHRIRIVTEFASRFVETDRELLRRIADNFLSNALKYSPPGGMVLLQFRSSESGALRLSVSDQGPGIEETDREHIFDLYVRLARDSHHHARASYGLGLPFCRLAAAALGGSVWVESNAQGGATFCVDLPHAPAPATSSRAAWTAA